MTGVGGDAFWLIYDAADERRALHRRRRPRDVARHDRGLHDARPRRSALSRPAARHAHRARRRRELGHGACRLRPPAAETLPGKRHRLCARRLSDDGAARALARRRRGTSWPRVREAAAIFLKDGDDPQATRISRARWRPSPATAGTASTTARWRASWCATPTPTTASSPLDDLKAQSARWGEPIKGRYRDVTIYETPAPTQGFAVLKMLNLLEPFELHKQAVPRARRGASDGAGQAGRLSRPRPPSRRSALRRRADGAADLQGLRRRAARADGSRRAPCRGTAFPPTAAWPATRSTLPWSTRPATRSR